LLRCRTHNLTLFDMCRGGSSTLSSLLPVHAAGVRPKSLSRVGSSPRRAGRSRSTAPGSANCRCSAVAAQLAMRPSVSRFSHVAPFSGGIRSDRRDDPRAGNRSAATQGAEPPTQLKRENQDPSPVECFAACDIEQGPFRINGLNSLYICIFACHTRAPATFAWRMT
jgi:hypothetical protein